MSGRAPLSAQPERLQVGRWIRSVVDFVLPPACTVCKRPGGVICAECATTITWVYGPACHRCGSNTDSPVSACWSCRQKPHLLSQIRTAVWFEGAIPELIHRLKYKEGFALAPLLSRYMAEAWPDWDEPVDLIVPVPLHPDRYKKRGYNQSALLTQALSTRIPFPWDEGAIRRVRYTRPQVGLSAHERQNNLRGAFQADPARIAGKHVLLIDDVFTTGSTLHEVAQATIAAGASRVSGYCLARAK